MWIGFLLGNTSLKCGLRDVGRTRSLASFPWRDLAARADELRALVRWESGTRIVAGSVRDDLLPRVELLLPTGAPPVLLARRDFPVPIENRYESPDEAGCDRLLAALAAGRRARGSGALVVDLGTAVTLSLVSPEGAFLGGLIGVGAGTLRAALREAAPRLAPHLGSGVPPIERDDPRAVPAIDTRSALQWGLRIQMLGGIRAMIAASLAQADFVPRVYWTGGGASEFAGELAPGDSLLPDLALEGLFLAWEAWDAGSSGEGCGPR